MWLRLKPLTTDDERIETAYRLLFSRSPTTPDRQVALRFLALNSRAAPAAGGADAITDSLAVRESQWKEYLQALLGLNEFHFVD